MRNLWTFGDSYTAHFYVPPDSKEPKNAYVKYKDWRGGTLPKIWAELLSEKLDINLINKAVGGSSNYNMFNLFVDSINDIKENDIIIFGWTSVLRYRIASDNIFEEVQPNTNREHFSKQTMEEILYNRSQPAWLKEVHDWIRLINDYCKLKNVKVFHWTSDIFLFRNIELDNMISPRAPDGDLLGYTNSPIHYENGISKGTIYFETNGEVDDGHQGEFGHIVTFKTIYNHIKNLI